MQYAAKLLEDDADKQRKIMGRDMEKAEILNQRLREIDRQRELYEAVRRQVDQKSMERNVPGSIEIVKAMAPSRPSADRRVILSVMALFLGLAGGAGVAMLRAGASKAIFVAEELSCSATVPFLGQLPQVTSTPNHLPLDDPMLAEGIRMVRTSLLERLGRERALDNVVLITSAGPGDGKTTVSVILARSLAQCGKRVLLVDADLRKPNIAAHLGLDSQIGLMEALTQGIDDSQVVVKTQTPRLSVLTAGHVCDGFDPELRVNGSFAIALERWREDYDVIIMDSPPVLAVADAQILASRADGTILIVRAEKTQRSEVAEAVYRLDASGGTLWGTIFIAPPRRRHSYAYGYGYGYGANS